MRLVGVDYGRRRLGLAMSDATGLLATPWQTLPADGTPAGAVRAVASAFRQFTEATLGEERVTAVVVGLPRRLTGEDSHDTADVRVFARQLEDLIGVPVHLQDERLSSREAESRLSLRERDWRARKARLDAAAAAIILQDYLDGLPRASAPDAAGIP